MLKLSRNTLFDRLDQTLYAALQGAVAQARIWQNPVVELVHFLRQIIAAKDTDLSRILKHLEINQEQLESEVDGAIAHLPTNATELSDFGYHIYLSLERAWILSSLHFNDTKIRSAWYIAALLETNEIVQILRRDAPSLLKLAEGNHLNELREIISGSPEAIEIAHTDAKSRAKTLLARQTQNKSVDDGSALGRFCVDLTLEARENRIDPIIGRENEIRSMIDILLRRRQNNPLLTGDAGVGKTALAEGLALAIVTGNVPPPMQNVRLLSLDVGALVAGAGVRGEFESRLKSVLREIYESAQPIIIFVDEIHTLMGSGESSFGTAGAANLLKPALARGALRLIGATTWEEFKRYIEKDAALTRRFQLLQVLEPTPKEAVEILHRLMPIFSAHHHVMILEEAAQAAVNLSHRYIPTRQLPDKAISLLDTACARAAMSIYAPPVRVEYLRRSIESIEIELAILQEEIELGIINSSKELRISELNILLEAETTSYQHHKDIWQKELDLVQRLQNLRQQFIATKNEGQHHDETAFDDDLLMPPSSAVSLKKNINPELKKIRTEINRCEKLLSKIRGISPLIHAHVDAAVVASVIADWTGIPVGKMMSDEVMSLLSLRSELAKRVVGQDIALAEIVLRIQTSRANLSDQNKPIGVFLLAGAAGTGKSELAHALAETLFEGRDNLVTLNMSEYREAHSISALTGSPPGYVGYGEAGVLTEPVRRRPHSVVVLEDIDKAHSDVRDVFNQIFDKGELENREGTLINFKNTLILMTTQLGADAISELLGSGEEISLNSLQNKLIEDLGEQLPTGFLGRTVLIPFLPLHTDTLIIIARKQLERIAKRLMDVNQISLIYEEPVLSHMVEHCINRQMGARSLVNYIEQTLLSQIATLCLESMQKERNITRIQLAKPVKKEVGIRLVATYRN